jgi:hypothetical protein
MQSNTSVQLMCKMDANSNIIFDSYKIVDNKGNQVQNSNVSLANFIVNELGKVAVSTLETGLATMPNFTPINNGLFVINVTDNFIETRAKVNGQYGGDGYRAEFVVGVNTVIKTAINIGYGIVGGASGLKVGGLLLNTPVGRTGAILSAVGGAVIASNAYLMN